MLGLLQDLVEVVVQSLCYSDILKAVLVLGAEVKDSSGSMIVEVDHL